MGTSCVESWPGNLGHPGSPGPDYLLGEGASVIRDTLVLNPSEHGNAYSNANIYSHPHTNCHSIAIPDAYPYLHADCHSIATTDAYSHSYSHP